MAPSHLFLRFLRQPVRVDRAEHAHHRVMPNERYAFAAGAQTVPVVAGEFGEACKDYPVFFVPEDGGLRAVALLGLRAGENLFVDERGRWTGRYIPALLRCYPFALAPMAASPADGDRLGLWVDAQFAGWNTEAGPALFEADGRDGPALDRALEFLRAFEREWQATRAFAERLQAAGLLADSQVQALSPDSPPVRLAGLLAVDDRRLYALDDATALALFRQGDLERITMHLLSLSNTRELGQRLQARPPAMAPAPRPPA